MDLVRDLLDKLVVDRHGRPLGRVDSIVFEMRDDGAPLVAAIEIGLVTIARRLHPALGRWARACENAIGIAADRPVRIPFSKITDFSGDVKLDVTASELATLALEHKARAIVSAIPGAS